MKKSELDLRVAELKRLIESLYAMSDPNNKEKYSGDFRRFYEASEQQCNGSHQKIKAIVRLMLLEGELGDNMLSPVEARGVQDQLIALAQEIENLETLINKHRRLEYISHSRSRMNKSQLSSDEAVYDKAANKQYYISKEERGSANILIKKIDELNRTLNMQKSLLSAATGMKILGAFRFLLNVTGVAFLFRKISTGVSSLFAKKSSSGISVAEVSMSREVSSNSATFSNASPTILPSEKSTIMHEMPDALQQDSKSKP